MKTNRDPEEDMERISRIKDFRKLFSDTMILTTHFFKRCVKVPKLKQKVIFEENEILDDS